ncbi:hypothetical protein [Mycolicibacterium fortuitum]|uniref:hypothetical protein n=1 Tax=Mycolicibacterium fortuitum TaxID=1766 RepID=UPI001AEF9F63|nr:hypothetical protein [Mycolicibacterium fortuitum]MBP3083720.1 hypothetical protein [Mycolicibacterium fortuitum]
MAYQVIAARRLQWDNLVWQVPLISLTAQAFLFTIALGGDSSRVARIISSLLSLVITFLCLALMARHRQSEIFDAHLLAHHEAVEWHSNPTLHGQDFAELRDTGAVDGGWTDNFIPRNRGKKTLRAYRAWVVGLYAFAIAATAVIMFTIFWPAVLNKPDEVQTKSTTNNLPPVTIVPDITIAPTITIMPTEGSVAPAPGRPK